MIIQRLPEYLFAKVPWNAIRIHKVYTMSEKYW